MFLNVLSWKSHQISLRKTWSFPLFVELQNKLCALLHSLLQTLLIKGDRKVQNSNLCTLFGTLWILLSNPDLT